MEMTNSGISPALVFLNMSIPLLINLYENKSRQEDKQRAFPNDPPTFNLPIKETFDFIIVGSGSAGSILARRLSEVYRVLLLEAGGEPPPIETVTTIIHFTKQVPSIHWEYVSTQQSYSGQSTNGFIKSTAGKMMGGSGSHNHCHYERGHPYDFDNWATVTGDDSWKYDNILKYFLKFENYRGQFTTSNGHHRKGGWIDVVASNVTFRDDLWFSAGSQLGFKVNIDANGPQQVGFMPVEYNRKMGRRSSSYFEFIKPIEGFRDNLTVRRFSMASQIIFDGSKATGVMYERHGIPQIAFASKEVILSAGAYISPVLLMRSGIGPEEELVKAGIKPVAFLPVGKNVQDHIVLLMPSIKVDDQSVFKYSMKNVTFDDYNEFVDKGEGFFSAYSSMHEAYIASKRAEIIEEKPDWPDIQLYFAHEYDGEDVLTCRVNVNRPTSRGTITLNTTATNLEDALRPVLDYNFYENGKDYDVMQEGIEYCLKIVESTTTFQRIGARFSPKILPACQMHAYRGVRTKKYWKCFIQQMSSTNNHVVGSNRMGHALDPDAVVDSKLRVRGIEGLRVVDASIMPYVTNANINAAVMMIAEKAAEDILNDWASTDWNPCN